MHACMHAYISCMHACMQACMHACTHTHTHTQPHVVARTHARTRAHTHTHVARPHGYFRVSTSHTRSLYFCSIQVAVRSHGSCKSLQDATVKPADAGVDSKHAALGLRRIPARHAWPIAVRIRHAWPIAVRIPACPGHAAGPVSANHDAADGLAPRIRQRPDAPSTRSTSTATAQWR